MVGLKNGHIHKNLTQNGERQRYSWGGQKKKRNIDVSNVMDQVQLLFHSFFCNIDYTQTLDCTIRFTDQQNSKLMCVEIESSFC